MSETYSIARDGDIFVSLNREELVMFRNLLNEVVEEGSVSSDLVLPDGTTFEIEMDDFTPEE